MNIRQVFESHCAHLKIDRRLVQKIKKYEQDFVHKNQSHINFFGGVLMGVDPVRFTSIDQLNWMNDILGIDEGPIETDILNLPIFAENESIWHVSSNPMNLSCFWLTHKFLTSRTLNKNDAYEGALACIMVLHYKFFTSILTNMFSKYNADPAIAQATYMSLSKRFGLKALGSWGELIRHRSETVIDKKELHYNRILNFEPDEDVVYMLNDTQGRVKSILNAIRDRFSEIQNNPEMILKDSSNTLEMDGVLKVRDKIRYVNGQIENILDSLSDYNSFVKEELVDITASVVRTMPKSALVKSLKYMVENRSKNADKDVEELIKTSMYHVFDYIQKNPNTMRGTTDVDGLVSRMLRVYQAPRASGEDVLKMRELAENIAHRATGSKNKVLLSAIRNAILTYILLRTFTNN